MKHKFTCLVYVCCNCAEDALTGLEPATSHRALSCDPLPTELQGDEEFIFLGQQLQQDLQEKVNQVQNNLSKPQHIIQS